jgi:rare lipoprotein A (peptidoglycan hydrolase)
MSTLTIETNTNNLARMSDHAAIYTNEILDQVVSKKNDVLRAMRKVVAIALFAISFVTISSALNLAYGKKVTAKKTSQRVASKIRQVGSRAKKATHIVAVRAKHAAASGEFRLLNIYKNLQASNPSYVQAMNNATAGKASWYGGMFHGRKTAMGTTYDMYAMTAAHRTLPLGTWVKVTNVQNGKDVIVQVTDRGPYVADRVMDLSKAAATELGYFNAGTTQIKMDIIGQGYASADEAEAALNQTASTGTQIAQASIIPTSFDISTRTANVSADSDVVSGILDAIASTVTAPVNAIAEIFA